MKKLFYLASPLILLASCASQEEPIVKVEENPTSENLVSIEDAVKIAENSVKTLSIDTRGASADKIRFKEIDMVGNFPTRGETNDESEAWGFYVINFQDGYALVSADKRRANQVYAMS